MANPELEKKALRVKLLRLMSRARENGRTTEAAELYHALMRSGWIDIEEELAGMDPAEAAALRERLAFQKRNTNP